MIYMSKYLKNKQGTTLVEILLYISLVSILLFAVSVFLSVLLQARIKNQVIADVESQGAEAMDTMTQEFRNIIALGSPLHNTTSSVLWVVPSASTTEQIRFFQATDTIYMSENDDPPYALTNSHVSSTNLLFANSNQSGRTYLMKISFTLTYRNPSNRNEYNYSKTFETTSSY